MGHKAYISNVVDKDTMRKIQQVVLRDLAEYLKNSFGPKGTNSCIKKLNALNVYSKDGHTILKSINFNGIIEQSIKDDVETITLNIVNTVGDGTTSAVILSSIIFDSLLEFIENHPGYSPADIERTLNKVCEDTITAIKKSAKTCTLEDIYDIAYISANGNKWIADIITNIYKDYGMGVFIDVAPSLGKDTYMKVFDGMTINTGYSDSCFITDVASNSATVDHPDIYFFEDPVDTKEMGVLFDAIISTNIVAPLNTGKYDEIVPTVIVTPHLSRDMSSLMDSIVDYQSKLDPGKRVPFLLITDTHQVDEIQDLYKLCGAKPIHKYIDAEIYKSDMEKGYAPTPQTIGNWAGKAEEVVAYSNRTKFINPAKMKNEDGTFSNEYNNLLSYLENELVKQKEDGDSGRTIGLLKRRINSLKSNLVEIGIGGMTMADRDANRHLVEDAVCNCRSAAKNGVGWGANASGLIALSKYEESGDHDILYDMINSILYGAYMDLSTILYSTCMSADDADAITTQIITRELPYDIRTGEFSDKIKSSIESDCVILSSVCRIIGIMVTCNQMIVPSPQHNVYTDLKEI